MFFSSEYSASDPDRMVQQANQRTWRFHVGAALWAAGCGLAAAYSLGTVACTLSLFLALYLFGFREKWSGEAVSAYSVYNRGGRALPGTFSAQQHDDEMRGLYGTARIDRSGDSAPAGDGKTAAPLSTPRTVERVSDEERVRRRAAAAAAAERRLLGAKDS